VVVRVPLQRPLLDLVVVHPLAVVDDFHLVVVVIHQLQSWVVVLMVAVALMVVVHLFLMVAVASVVVVPYHEVVESHLQ
jgi:hypothetical protein